MPKKIKHESFRYSLLYEAQKLKFINIKEPNLSWSEFLNNLTFKFIKREVHILWIKPMDGSIIFSIEDVLFYKKKKKAFSDTNYKMSAKQLNKKYFTSAVKKLAESAMFNKT